MHFIYNRQKSRILTDYRQSNWILTDNRQVDPSFRPQGGGRGSKDIMHRLQKRRGLGS